MPRKAPVATVQQTLTDGTPAAQANILLDLIEYIAEGKSVSSVVSDVCKVRDHCWAGECCSWTAPSRSPWSLGGAPAAAVNINESAM
jgi:hypothetical protein